ncbi:hypothetical protein [Rodentibacter heidelbergensis]|uniref:Transferrin-binding protein B C-lobe/N-lobe beta barrel domain-containing protein n=1 Tax=Rodentibacter heidelbergensis TaxID=1908258 RepID=A0A1V3I7H1_9PAST|nr:hypothetical protein [Rodentibacter heidelbergensis]OOF36005.1 hypothetical protein BKK48_07780 [Rodentibacter heidelbergensis]
MNVTMKTAAAVLVAFMLAGCGSNHSSNASDKKSQSVQPAKPSLPAKPKTSGKATQSAKESQSGQSNQSAKPSQSPQQNQTGQASQSPQQNPAGQASQPSQQNPAGQASQPSQQNPAGQASQPSQQNPAGQATQPPQQNPAGQVTQPSQQNQTGQANQPSQQNPAGQANQPPQQNQSGQPNQPSNPIPPTVSTPQPNPVHPKVPVIPEGERVINLEGKSQGLNYLTLVSRNTGLFTENNNQAVRVDLGKLAKGQLGLHEGVFTDPNLTVDDGSGKNEVNYVVMNTPYSSYGMLFTDNQGIGAEVASFIIGKPGIETLINVPQGTATYRGEVIASIRTYGANSPYIINNAFQKEGSVTLTADFDNRRISGLLDSTNFGKINLNATDIDNPNPDYYTYRGSISPDSGVDHGDYRGVLGEHESWGVINLRVNDNGQDKIYNGIYSAPKQ